MGFGDFLKAAAGSVGSYAKAQMDEIQKYKELYDHYDDERLWKKYMNETGTRKMACYQLLKERGYGKSKDE